MAFPALPVSPGVTLNTRKANLDSPLPFERGTHYGFLICPNMAPNHISTLIGEATLKKCIAVCLPPMRLHSSFFMFPYPKLKNRFLFKKHGFTPHPKLCTLFIRFLCGYCRLNIYMDILIQQICITF